MYVGLKDCGTQRRCLVYTTPALKEDVNVGPIKAKIFASSSAADTDFVAKLVDVYPDVAT